MYQRSTELPQATLDVQRKWKRKIRSSTSPPSRVIASPKAARLSYSILLRTRIAQCGLVFSSGNNRGSTESFYRSRTRLRKHCQLHLAKAASPELRRSARECRRDGQTITWRPQQQGQRQGLRNNTRAEEEDKVSRRAFSFSRRR